jgi:FkbM family methyltransferase
MASLKEAIKALACRVLSKNSYDRLLGFYSKILRFVDEPITVKQILLHIKQKKIDRLITRHSLQAKDFFFIQIGSCDGETEDPIYDFVTRFHWRGVLVEPLSHLFEKLRVTYQNQTDLSLENIAISRDAGVRKLYRINSTTTEGYVPWYERSSSFYKEHLLNQIDTIRTHFPGAQIIAEDVRCQPLEYLLAKYRVQKIDLLHIDAEGYDFEIIKMIPFTRLKPNMILYESAHLTGADQKACKQLLASNGYQLLTARVDTFAYLP